MSFQDYWGLFGSAALIPALVFPLPWLKRWKMTRFFAAGILFAGMLLPLGHGLSLACYIRTPEDASYNRACRRPGAVHVFAWSLSDRSIRVGLSPTDAVARSGHFRGSIGPATCNGPLLSGRPFAGLCSEYFSIHEFMGLPDRSARIRLCVLLFTHRAGTGTMCISSNRAPASSIESAIRDIPNFFALQPIESHCMNRHASE